MCIRDSYKHFLVVHAYVSDEARKEMLTPPEKRDPPQSRRTEREWAQENAKRKTQQLFNTGLRMRIFFIVIGSLKVNRMYTEHWKKRVWKEDL